MRHKNSENDISHVIMGKLIKKLCFPITAGRVFDLPLTVI